MYRLSMYTSKVAVATLQAMLSQLKAVKEQMLEEEQGGQAKAEQACSWLGRRSWRAYGNISCVGRRGWRVCEKVSTIDWKAWRVWNMKEKRSRLVREAGSSNTSSYHQLLSSGATLRRFKRREWVFNSRYTGPGVKERWSSSNLGGVNGGWKILVHWNIIRKDSSSG